MPAFRGPLAFLSNFHPSPMTIRLKGGTEVVFPTVEHLYQALKTQDPTWFERIRTAPTPGQAKRLGRQAPLRPDFGAKKVSIMQWCLRQKFSQHLDLAAQLRATGETPLVEENEWGDTYWGVCHGVGENHLGKLLMALRTTLAKETTDVS